MSDYKELIKKLRQSAQGRKHFCTNHGTNVTPNYIRFMFEAADVIEQLVKERDAAMDDIPRLCWSCKSNENKLKCDKCNRLLEYRPAWEWRGLGDNDGKID